MTFGFQHKMKFMILIDDNNGNEKDIYLYNCIDKTQGFYCLPRNMKSKQLESDYMIL